jgi:serine/threonine-protein kinase
MPQTLPELDDGFLGSIGDLRPGSRLGDYELLLPVGRGGMAVVWASRAARSGTLVAVKTMLPALSQDPRFIAMFEVESRIASGIRHPNVCEVLAFGRERGVAYLVMEWIDGVPLSSLREDGSPIPLAIAVRIVADAALGLHAAHELTDGDGKLLGLVHRDVSPQNVLVNVEGMTKIVDFGVAKATEAGARATQSGYIKGKVDYLSPEQAFSEPIDRRADVFALGAVLYELTTGKRPFEADTQMATLVRVTSPEPVSDPRELVTDYPECLAPIVMRALEKDKLQRYATMLDFRVDLSSILAELGPTSGSDVSAYVKSVAGARCELREGAIRKLFETTGQSAVSRLLPGIRRDRGPALRLGRFVALGAIGGLVGSWFALRGHASTSSRGPAAQANDIEATAAAPVVAQPEATTVPITRSPTGPFPVALEQAAVDGATPTISSSEPDPANDSARRRKSVPNAPKAARGTARTKSRTIDDGLLKTRE